MKSWQLSKSEAELLARCAHALLQNPDSDQDEALRFLECAAVVGNQEAQLSLGLWHARMDIKGRRRADLSGAAKYKQALRWLCMAAEQGSGKAWYAMSRIYATTVFSQRNLLEARHCLEQAADAGYFVAQSELGAAIWRGRKHDPSGDVRAVYWLQKAAAQGCRQACALLGRIAASPQPCAWAQAVERYWAQAAFDAPPILAARVSLAACFGLSVAEALLVDPGTANRGHCLVIDIRAQYARARRRLILVETDSQRWLLDRAALIFNAAAAGPGSCEGNYRQRLYRLRTTVPKWAQVVRGGAGEAT